MAELAGTHEWDAVNEDWIPSQQVGWRSTSGLENNGRVRFTDLGNQRTQVDVLISYNPPAGVLGEVVDWLGIDTRFDQELERDLQHFARMVEQAPAGALDPMQSHYLFHDASAVQQGKATGQQTASMQQDPMMSQQALHKRADTVQREQAQTQEALRNQQTQRQQRFDLAQQTVREQAAALDKQAAVDRREARERVIPPIEERELDPIHDTIGGRNASMARTALGDQDARSERYPDYHQDPMMSRAPGTQANPEQPHAADIELESPWRASIQGRFPGEPAPETAAATRQHEEEPEQRRKDTEQGIDRPS